MFGSVKHVSKNINTNGIGLGLVISQNIVHSFGGEISFLSKYKVGTIFTFSFKLEPLFANARNSRVASIYEKPVPSALFDVTTPQTTSF